MITTLLLLLLASIDTITYYSYEGKYYTLHLSPGQPPTFQLAPIKIVPLTTDQLPDPDPPPLPPTNLDPLPYTSQGLRVLIIYEKDDAPKQLLDILTSPSLRAYLNANCVKNSTNQPMWAILDKDVPLDNSYEIWKSGMASPRAQVPWMIVSNGKKWDSKPILSTDTDNKLITYLSTFQQ